MKKPIRVHETVLTRGQILEESTKDFSLIHLLKKKGFEVGGLFAPMFLGVLTETHEPEDDTFHYRQEIFEDEN